MNKEEILKLIKQKETEARSKDITPEQRAQLISEIENLKRDLKNFGLSTLFWTISMRTS